MELAAPHVAVTHDAREAPRIVRARQHIGGIGIVGVLSVAAVCVTPYLQLAVHYALYKLAAGIAESFADKRVGRLIGGFADVYGFLLGMVGVASLILFLSIVSSMKAVTG